MSVEIGDLPSGTRVQMQVAANIPLKRIGTVVRDKDMDMVGVCWDGTNRNLQYPRNWQFELVSE